MASHPARRDKEHDVVDLSVRIERPLAARVTMDGRAVLSPVLVCALRRGRKFEDDLEAVLLAVKRVLRCHAFSFIRLAPSGPHHLRHRGRTRLAASQARSLDAETNSTATLSREPKRSPRLTSV